MQRDESQMPMSERRWRLLARIGVFFGCVAWSEAAAPSLASLRRCLSITSAWWMRRSMLGLQAQRIGAEEVVEIRSPQPKAWSEGSSALAIRPTLITVTDPPRAFRPALATVRPAATAHERSRRPRTGWRSRHRPQQAIRNRGRARSASSASPGSRYPRAASSPCCRPRRTRA
jgi:hypothetical protein